MKLIMKSRSHIAFRPAPKTIRPAIGAIIVAATCLVSFSPALGQQDRVEAVTLSSGGLAEIRRTIAVEGSNEISFDVPLEQVDDILKSLLVSDPAGGVSFLTLDGLSPVEETFRSLPFSPETLGSVPELLASLQGVEVRVSSSGRTLEGRVLGVQARRTGDGEASEPIVSVMIATGQIEVLPLGTDTTLDILDAAMLDSIRRAADVSGQGRIETLRTITLTLEDTSERNVDLDYVVEAPIWKTAYRLILGPNGAARVQAWAIIENASGHDWSEIELTLSSGTPVTMAQRLHERYWAQRPQIPVLAQTIAPVRPDAFGEMSVQQAGRMADAVETSMPILAPAPAMNVGASAPSSAAMVAQSTESDTAATYRLPVPIDLPAGQTLSVPFIDADLAADRISIFQPERNETHPIAAIRLENTTGASLPRGIATVFAPTEEGYAGDAQLDGLPTGESRILSFAADRKVTVATSQGTEETAYRATLVDGVLRVSSRSQMTTIYTISGAEDAGRTVVIEQPRRDGWTIVSDHLASNTPTHHRLEVDLDQGETVQVQARFERPRVETIALVEADVATLGYWSNALGASDVGAALEELAQRRGAIAQIERRIATIDHDIATIVEDQERIRANLGALEGGSTLAQRYVTMLEEQEDRLAELQGQRRAVQQELNASREDLSRHISQLSL